MRLTEADVERELREFEAFAKRHPNGTIHVKWWDHQNRDYEFGHVLVLNGHVDPIVYVPLEDGKTQRLPFDTLRQLVVDGWIGD